MSLNDPRALCRTCGHVRALHRTPPRDKVSIVCSVKECNCTRFADSGDQGEPVCLVCKRSDGDVELVIFMSETRSLNTEIHLCRHHLSIYSYHVARILGDLLHGRLSIP